MAALQFLSKYRETGLLLIRASIGLIFIILIAPVLWNGEGSWEHFGSAMRHLDFHSHFKFWGFVGAVATFVVFAWRDHDEYVIPAAEVARIDGANLAERRAVAGLAGGA